MRAPAAILRCWVLRYCSSPPETAGLLKRISRPFAAWAIIPGSKRSTGKPLASVRPLCWSAGEVRPSGWSLEARGDTFDQLQPAPGKGAPRSQARGESRQGAVKDVRHRSVQRNGLCHRPDENMVTEVRGFAVPDIS